MQVNGRPAVSQGRDNEGSTLSYAFAWRLDSSSTVGRALAAANQRLRGCGVDTPRLDAELLLAHVLDTDRVYLYAHADRPLSEEERTRYEHLIERRRRREPVAYLVGSRAFYGLDFAVDSRVLVPRPETELLVETAISTIDMMSQRVAVNYSLGRGRSGLRPASNGSIPPLEAVTIADIGTGSGVIAISLARHCPSALVWASDVSADALAVAYHNMQVQGVADRIRLVHGFLLNPIPEPVDVITANLPYIPTQDIDRLAPEISLHEPRQALDGGYYGLQLIGELLNQAPRYLRPGGVILLEIGSDQGAVTVGLARRAFPNAEVRLVHDFADLDRLVVVQT